MANFNIDRKYREQIGQRIRYTLISKNITQAELAEAIGVTPGTISYFVSGARTPNTKYIADIARYLCVSSDYLLGLYDAENHEDEATSANNHPVPFVQIKRDIYEQLIKAVSDLDTMCAEIHRYGG